MNMNFLLAKLTDNAMKKGLEEALVLAEQNINNQVVIVLPETKHPHQP